jgi:hypothetical protein
MGIGKPLFFIAINDRGKASWLAHGLAFERTASRVSPPNCRITRSLILCLYPEIPMLGPVRPVPLNPLQSNFSATRILPSSYLFWVAMRLVGYL